MLMIPKNHHLKSRALSMFLVMLMLLSTTIAIASTASASMARSYTTNRDPHDVAIGDFNCDGFNDLAMATDGTHTISILWNDGNGDFSERQDIWVSKNTSRDAEWDEFSNVQFIEVGEFTGDNAIDLVIFQRNNPFKTDDNGAPAGDPGNVTIIENGGCSEKSWSIGARFTHFYAWDLAVGDANQDGNDDVYILDLMADITTQRVVTYRGPITSNTPAMITSLGSSQQNTYRNLEVGDWGEVEAGIAGGCNSARTDDDIWLQRAEGLDYSTGQVTNPGNDDNMTIIEYNCLTNTYPTSYTFSATNPPPNSHVINMNTITSENFDIGDMDEDGVIDVMVLNDENLENATYVTSSAVGTWSSPTLVYFGPYISWNVAVTDLNGDQEPDFINPTIAYQQNTTDSAGGSTSSFYLNFPTTVQVTLSDGNGGHLSPLSYAAGRRPNVVEVGQLAGSSNSADDLVVGHANWRFSGWRDNFGWEGQYDTISVIEMDSKDLSVSSIEISPVDKFYGVVGEGTRNINVTVTNTGMDILNGQQATLDVELKIVDQANSSNTSVYEMDWDAPENKASCGGCTWSYEEYIEQSTYWHEETNHSTGGSDGNNDPNVSANYNNPTDFMWAGQYKTNSSGASWSGYGRNWDDAMVLEDVDLTGSDRAFMSLELFQHLGHGVLGSLDSSGNYLAGDVWDDIAMIEIGSVETGWSTLACPQSAQISGACASGESMWGGFDLDRMYKQSIGGAPEGIYYYGVYSFGTYYGWNNFTEDGVGAFDLSPWAGETVDIRFRLRTGFDGSISDDNESLWSGRDGYAVDNISIWKQTTAFEANPQVQQTNVPLNNLGPGQEYTSSITADLLNDTTYRISATLTGNSWDEQPQNDEIIGYITPYNLYDPMVESLEYFNPGGLYAEGVFDIEVATNNWGNTAVDFDVKATVYSATPSDIYCGTPSALCQEDFEGGSSGYRYEESQNPKGAIYGENTCTDKIFNNYAYWFGHPCDTGSNGYGDAWANETLTIPDVDLTSMNGDFVSLNFEYYAHTFYGIDSDQTSIVDVNDYAAMTLDILRDGATYSSVVMGQWNDYNEDGTCQVDENGDNIVNASEPIDYAEISYIGDDASTDGTGGNYNVFFNTNDLVKTTSIDLTHLYMLNTSDTNTGNWAFECTSLAGSTIDINFEFQSDDDGRNGINDGFKGVAFNNITLQEFTFIEDNSYTISRTNVDAEQSSTDFIASHEFFSGVYKIDVETIFDNTTVGKSWFNDNELSVSNNRETVIFNVESVDITLYAPTTLNCLNDQTLECLMPIDSALGHDWTFKAMNGVLAGDYVFNMNIDDMTTGSQAHTTTAGPAQSLTSHQFIDVAFTPWNGWMDGHEYNISFDAELANGNPTGNVRYFHATFAEHIDVAILSDSTPRTSTIKEDLDILGMTYTQFAINDWDTYFEAGWFTHYDKIILPWQTDIAAKDEPIGNGYYEKLDSGNRKNTLENFMFAGGTIQAHLGPQGTQVYGEETSRRLPLDLYIQEKDTGDDTITYSETNFADPYHPLMDNVNLAAFQGFDSSATVALAVLKTNQQSVTTIPAVCGGDSESKKDGTLQRIIRQGGTPADQKNTILGVCSYQSGGIIVSTIDVATHSDRANSSTLPLLGNMLSYQVTPYPTGFGVLGNGLDLQINGITPDNNPSTGGYTDHFIKSNADLTFSFVTDTTESLETDWIIEGPSAWDGATMASGTDHITDTSPMTTLCKFDATQGGTGCAQGVEWVITLILHDAAGHSRVITVTVETDDIRADSFLPVADAVIDMRETYAEQIEFIGTNTILGNEWDVHRITLDELNPVTIYFDASNSSDEDSLVGNGIEKYEWRVLFDARYDDTDFDITGHSFTKGSSTNGSFAYTFSNVTKESESSTSNQIRIELIVYDGADKYSSVHKMYFEIVEGGYGDVAPATTYDLSTEQDCPTDPCRIVDDNITIIGNILAGNEGGEGGVTVEIAFSPETLNETSDKKQYEKINGNYSFMSGLADFDNWSLTLSLDGRYTNASLTQTIYIKAYEGTPSNPRNPVYHQIDITLPMCQGQEAPIEAFQAGGEWVLEANNKCQWLGEWTYEDGEWNAGQNENEEESTKSVVDGMLLPAAIGLVLIIVVILSLMFIRKGSNDDSGEFAVGETGFGGVIDQTEQYVQQLIAQGYPEETARAYAQQYAAQAAEAAVAAAPVAAAPEMDNAVYQQYYQQFVSQGYDATTAATYAQQYALQYAQSQQ